MIINAWGINPRGQLAAGFYGPVESPVSCLALPPNTVGVGGAYLGFTGMLLDDGSMRMLGGGINGEMGNGKRRPSTYLPVTPHLNKAVEAFACAGAHIVALQRDGTVACWGGNSFGTLGNGTSGEGEERAGVVTPIEVRGVSDVVQVATSNGIVACLTSGGGVVTWGTGSALGIGRAVTLKSSEGATPHVVPKLSGVTALATGGLGAANHVLALLEDGTVAQWGAHRPCGTSADLLSPTPVAGLRGIIAVAAGASQSFALDAEGRLWGWGANKFGELFLGPNIEAQTIPIVVASNIQAVGCGLGYTLALTGTGVVKGAGRNDANQLAGVGQTGVEAIVACEHHAFSIGGRAISPPVMAHSIPEGLEVAWTAPAMTHTWEVTANRLGESTGKLQRLAPTTRAVRIPAAVGETLTVKVRGGAEWPARTVVAVV